MNVQPARSEPGAWVNPNWQEGDPGLFAVIIGVSHYRHLGEGEEEAPNTYGLPQLKVSALTAHRVFRWLADEYYVDGCPLAKCWMLLAPTDAEKAYAPAVKENLLLPTFDDCQTAIGSWFATLRGLGESAAKKARAFFFFSGHGLEVHQERQILLPHDYLSPPTHNWETAISTQNLRFGMASLHVPKQFFFIDACRNDHKDLRAKAIRGVKILPEDESALVNSQLVAPLFYATSSGQQAFQQPEPDKGLSLFGTALVDGFSGKPDIQLEPAGNLLSVNLYPLQGYVEGRVVESLAEAGGELTQPVKLSGTVRNETVTYIKGTQPPATILPSGPPPVPPDARPSPGERADRLIQRLDVAYETKRSLRGARTTAWATDKNLAHSIFGSEHVTEIWTKNLRLFSLSTDQPIENRVLHLHRIERVKHTRGYRVEFSIGTHDENGYWIELIDTTNTTHGCVLPSDSSGETRYLADFDVADDKGGGGRQVTRFEISLAENEGLLGKAAECWRKYKTSDLGHAVIAIEDSQLEELLRQKLSSPLAATISALILLRAGHLKPMHDWAKNLANWFPSRPDGPVLWAEQMLRRPMRSQETLKEAIHYLLMLNERGLPHTSETFSYAASLVDRLLSVQQHLSSVEKLQLRQLQRRIDGALAYFRPGGLFSYFSGFEAGSPPSQVIRPLGAYFNLEIATDRVKGDSIAAELPQQDTERSVSP